MSYYYDVRDVVMLIPPGRVTTYGAIADFLTLGSARMVGWALKQSSLAGAPAHRVVNRKGELSGRANFPDPDYMQRVLEKEGLTIENHTVKDFKGVFWHPENILNK